MCLFLSLANLGMFSDNNTIIMANKPILYYVIRSPPCRAVLMASKAIGVELELKVTETWKRENRTPEFLKVSQKLMSRKLT